MLFLDVNENEINNAEKLQEMIDNKKNVFVLVYMIGCAPCKNTLPEWNKLKGCKELEQFKNNDDIIVANVEQSMCEKMHHKDLENIMSFPTIKHIKHNEVHDYNDERNTSGFSKWIKGLIKKDGKLKDLNSFVIKDKNKQINHGNIDMLMKPRFARKRIKTKRIKPVKKKKAKSIKKIRKQNKQNKNTNTNKRKKRNIYKINKTKSKSKTKTKSRRIF